MKQWMRGNHRRVLLDRQTRSAELEKTIKTFKQEERESTYKKEKVMVVHEALGLVATCKRLKPHLLMIVVQVASAFLYFITEAAFNHGLNPHVYVTYRHIVGTIVVLPFAYYLERKTRPKLTLKMFAELFVFALLGVGLSTNMYFASLKYTSPTFVSATVNTIPTLTFILSVVFRIEALNVRDHHGLGKVIGSAVSLAGVMTLTLYRGQHVKSLWSSPLHFSTSTFHQDWFRGSVLCVASCIAWSIWFTMQGSLLKRYPAQLSLATWANLLGAAQSAVFTAFITRHEQAAWNVTSYIDISAILFGGLVSSALNSVMLIWCTKVKGPVFVTMFCPLQTLLVVVFAYFILSESLYMGSIVGGFTIITGLYLFLWGKAGDTEVCVRTQKEILPTCKEQNNIKLQSIAVKDSKEDAEQSQS
ncbi:hypothetical protein V2J09_022127 [Rumex salicifolius]